MEVKTVVKVDKIWQVVHSGPDQRLPGAETLPDRRQKGALRPDMGMTVHTRFRGREPSKSTHFYCSVTVASVNSQATHMTLVTARNGLLARYAILSSIA